MASSTNGGIGFLDSTTAKLEHYIISNADFSGAIDQNGIPTHNSAADMIFKQITQRASVVLINPISQISDGMSFALDQASSAWDSLLLQKYIRLLGANGPIGIDQVDVSTVVVTQVDYDLTRFSNLVDLLDVDVSYSGNSGKALIVNDSEDGLELGTIDLSSNQGYLATNGNITQTISTIGTIILFDNQINNNSDIVYTEGNFTVLSNKTYLVNATISANKTNNTRTQVLWSVYVNGTEYNPSKTYTYHRDQDTGKSTAIIQHYLNLSPNDVISIRGRTESDTITTVANACTIYIG